MISNDARATGNWLIQGILSTGTIGGQKLENVKIERVTKEAADVEQIPNQAHLSIRNGQRKLYLA